VKRVSYSLRQLQEARCICGRGGEVFRRRQEIVGLLVRGYHLYGRRRGKGDLVDEVRLLVGKRRDVHVIDARRRRGHGRGGAFDVHWWSAHVVFPGVSFALLATRIGSHWHLHISSMGGMTLVLKRQRLGVATLGLLPW
jgi:hypothetical protein